MRKWEDWMTKGYAVIAYGKSGKITKVETNVIDGVKYAYYIHVQLDGGKFSNPYHPNDVEQPEGSEVANG